MKSNVPDQSRVSYSRLIMILSDKVLNIPKDGNSTVHLGLMFEHPHSKEVLSHVQFEFPIF